MPDPRPKRRPGLGHGNRSQFQPQGARASGQRRVDSQETKERFLIVCEGEKTEPNYFRNFRMPGRVVETRGTGYNTLSLVDEAIRLKQEGEAEALRRGESAYDQIWCVFDRDSFEADAFNNAIRRAQAVGFQVAYTNQAFELWYLLHFDDHRTALDRSHYRAILKDRLGHTYRKDSRSMYQELQSRQDQAIRRAETLLAGYGEAHNPQQDNPCTTVHLLVKALRANVSP